MSKHRDPKQRVIGLTIVVLIAVALLFLSGCAYIVTPNRIAPATVVPLAYSPDEYDMIH
jgi:uncharacterized protein YceK